ncbi:unnamed protein product [Nesidiocoris tenuis]|uniref:Protein LMBR1L n=1 Tax=Nesidiocoris tenuis TaxID=355587 RepID=A0A6H5GH28_9HEMI|nr:unnamed protein product [Nesidiocoris tenuis]
MPDYGDELDDEYVDDRERLFHTTVRENIIFLLVFVILFILSSTIVDKLRRNDREDYFSNDEDEATVYRVSLYLCVFSLSVTLCAAMLHPVSIISNEVLLLYPKSYYVKWLNHSLIQGFGISFLPFLYSCISFFGVLLLLEKQKYTSSFQRNVVYPIAMLALLALTAITTFLVLVNSLQLLIGVKAVPKSTAQFTLGLTSLSKLGTVGAVIEVLVIFYLIVTSYVGIYSLPFLKHLRPRQHKTPLSLLISNCGLLLILSSALPLLARTLGITNFDLLGHFGRIEWLGNFKIVFMYNLLFASVTTLCLVNKLTAPVVKELLTR